MSSYHIGDEFRMDIDPIGSFWLREEYDCKYCKGEMNAENTYKNPATHVALINLKNKKIMQVLNEKDFLDLYKTDDGILLPFEKLDYKASE